MDAVLIPVSYTHLDVYKRQVCEQCIAMTVVNEEATANYVPAAAVIRREQALSGITGRKGRVGGCLSQV